MLILDMYQADHLKPRWDGTISSATTAAELEAPYPGTGSQLPSWYSGVPTAVPAGIGAGLLETLASGSSILSSVMPDSGEGSARQFFEQLADDARERARKRFAPDPWTATAAAQITYSVVRDIEKAGIAAATAAPLALAGAPGLAVAGATAIGYGVNTGIQEAAELRMDGVDRWTANKVGLARGATGAVGFAIPAALPVGRVASAVYGAFSNAGLGMADRQATHYILERADYSEAAERYAPDDPLSVVMDIFVGGTFGALGGAARNPKGVMRQVEEILKKSEPERLEELAHRFASKETGKERVPTQEEADAARILITNEANRVNLLVDPVNQEKLSRAYDTQEDVARQIEEGLPVAVPEGVVDDSLVGAVHSSVRIELASELKKDNGITTVKRLKGGGTTASAMTLADADRLGYVASRESIRVFIRSLNNTIQASDPHFEWITVAKEPGGKEHRVLGENGNPNIGLPPFGVPGIKPLPIRLQEDTVLGGHLNEHLEGLRRAGYNSPLEAVKDIAQNYTRIYEPSENFKNKKKEKGEKSEGIVLVRPIFMTAEEARSGADPVYRGVLLTELQEEAGCYRVGSVMASNKTAYLKNRKLLWEKTLPIRERESIPPTLPPELTEPEYVPAPLIVGEKVGTINDLVQATAVREARINAEKVARIAADLPNNSPEDLQIHQKADDAMVQRPDLKVAANEKGETVYAVDLKLNADKKATVLEDVGDNVGKATECLITSGLLKV